MKTYLVFAGENYYPDGGANDFVGAYSKEEAFLKARELAALHGTRDCWVQIARFDLEAGVLEEISRKKWRS